jgi:hypothetical protein
VTREIVIDGDVAYVPLTQGLVAVIDASDVALVRGMKWAAVLQYRVHYAVTSVLDGGKRRILPMHRLLMGQPKGKGIDHIDSNGLNNRKANLRVASVSENARNTGRKASNSSGVKGVSWRADRQKWQVHIRVDGKRLSLGHYTELADAAAAYAEAATKFHGEFARLA